MSGGKHGRATAWGCRGRPPASLSGQPVHRRREQWEMRLPGAGRDKATSARGRGAKPQSRGGSRMGRSWDVEVVGLSEGQRPLAKSSRGEQPRALHENGEMGIPHTSRPTQRLLGIWVQAEVSRWPFCLPTGGHTGRCSRRVLRWGWLLRVDPGTVRFSIRRQDLEDVEGRRHGALDSADSLPPTPAARWDPVETGPLIAKANFLKPPITVFFTLQPSLAPHCATSSFGVQGPPTPIFLFKSPRPQPLAPLWGWGRLLPAVDLTCASCSAPPAVSCGAQLRGSVPSVSL